MKFDLKLLVAFAAITAAVYLVLYLWGKPIMPTLTKGSRNFAFLMPVLLLSFLMASGVIAMIPKGSVEQWMGAATGIKGMAIASFIGVLTPGSPAVDFPIALALLRGGAGIGAILAMLVAGKVWSLSMLPVEASVVGLKFTLIHYAAVFTAPFAAGFIGQWIWNLYVGSPVYDG